MKGLNKCQCYHELELRSSSESSVSRNSSESPAVLLLRGLLATLVLAWLACSRGLMLESLLLMLETSLHPTWVSLTYFVGLRFLTRPKLVVCLEQRKTTAEGEGVFGLQSLIEADVARKCQNFKTAVMQLKKVASKVDSWQLFIMFTARLFYKMTTKH